MLLLKTRDKEQRASSSLTAFSTAKICFPWKTKVVQGEDKTSREEIIFFLEGSVMFRIAPRQMQRSLNNLERNRESTCYQGDYLKPVRKEVVDRSVFWIGFPNGCGAQQCLSKTTSFIW